MDDFYKELLKKLEGMFLKEGDDLYYAATHDYIIGHNDAISKIRIMIACEQTYKKD